MPRIRPASRDISAGIALLAALIALCIAIYSYFTIGSGIEYTIGVLIVICSTALLLCAGAVVALVPGLPFWLRLLLNIGIFADIIGSGVAAYFLEADAVMALLGIALLAWIVHVTAGARTESLPVEAAGART